MESLKCSSYTYGRKNGLRKGHVSRGKLLFFCKNQQNSHRYADKLSARFDKKLTRVFNAFDDTRAALEDTMVSDQHRTEISSFAYISWRWLVWNGKRTASFLESIVNGNSITVSDCWYQVRKDLRQVHKQRKLLILSVIKTSKQLDSVPRKLKLMILKMAKENRFVMIHGAFLSVQNNDQNVHNNHFDTTIHSEPALFVIRAEESVRHIKILSFAIVEL